MVSLLKRVLSACAAVALLATGSVAFAGTASALNAPACPSYGTPAQTTTSVTLTPPNPSAGDKFRATATVEVDGRPVTGGTVVFNYRGTKDTQTVVNGTATSREFTAKKGSNQEVRANYRGSCTNGTAAVSASQGAQILGVEAFAGNGNNNGNGNGGTLGAAGTNAGGGAVGGLAATGLTPGAQLIGLTGIALLVAGASTLVIRRRRVTVI
ncbi:hypothetical protein [Nocardioides iriomotensis]|uniref:LPXTG cell wall anchor domain-containing protein n=1 Tax=Nocardioides iriomotensis TaxID=715784 RepID=A0A4Q5J7E0_9ACTN|nr:hypothetical protein [Nocardioides iriomotensis]RYU13699.1 hypothetical protein ETU37_05510 [Nocardioides iriomotensis]